MKIQFSLAGLLLCIATFSHSQDLGYRTFDIGMEGMYTANAKSPSLNLQGAANAEEHHSFVFSLGFKRAYRPITGTHDNEKGSGWGLSLGYRYYFSVVPKGLFIGARCEGWMMNIYHTAPEVPDETKLTLLRPNVELGGTLLINDMYFITAYFSAGKLVKLKTQGKPVGFGDGFAPVLGLSGGWRF